MVARRCGRGRPRGAVGVVVPDDEVLELQGQPAGAGLLGEELAVVLCVWWYGASNQMVGAATRWGHRCLRILRDL